jgi:branched-subunit amino acid aminotransferase/4-amino-4-deoxychorismate lyase
VPLYLNDYLDRFYRSALVMGLQGVMERDQLRGVIAELIERNKMSEAGIKMILTGGYSPDAYQPVKGNFIVTQHPLVLPSQKQVEEGIKIITYPYRRDIPEVKTINYIMGVWLQKQVREMNAADVLYHLNDEVSEFPRCNFFLVTKEGILVTSDKHILHGITRMKVLHGARKLMRVEERTVTLLDVSLAQEAFLTSTTKGILPIVTVDDWIVGDGKPGPITRALHEALVKQDHIEIEKWEILTNK